jgi:inosine-uridine nucleoside N-ribohydrolase
MKLLAGFLLVSAAFAQNEPKSIPVIFDTDIGDDIDDALALALALQSPELDVRLVTTVADDVESRTRLAWKELGLFHRQNIPLATGAPEPLLDPKLPDQAAQFGVLTSGDRPPAAARQRASDRIIETLMKSPVKMTLIPVGPLTNIALALKEEPQIKAKIERIVLMGGAYYPARREYNIYRDRVAAEIVFASGVPITGVGLDVTEKCKLEGPDLDRLKNAHNPASEFLYRLIELWQKENPGKFPTLHDPLAVATAVRSTLVETQRGSVKLAPDGATIFTPDLTADAKPGTQVAKDVNVREFLDLFLSRVAAPPRRSANSSPKN